MTVPRNLNRYYSRTATNYNSCSWLGLLIKTGTEMIDQDGNRIAPDGVIVAAASSAAFARAQLMEHYRSRGYVTAQEIEEYQLHLNPEEWEFDFDIAKRKITYRARALDAPPRKKHEIN